MAGTLLKWGIIGAGNIAGSFANGVAGSATGELIAIGSRSLEKASRFSKEHKIPKAYGSYEDLLDDGDVQAEVRGSVAVGERATGARHRR